MGNPKQKWTSEEEEALRAGVAKHGTGKWKNIQRDPEFNPYLFSRSNIDLKDKWRNMSVSATGQGPREKSRMPKAKASSDSPAAQLSTPQTFALPATVAHDASTDPIVDDSARSSAPKYNALIFEALSVLKEPNGSDITAILRYIEQRNEVPQNFRRLLGSRLRRLVAQEKLEKLSRMDILNKREQRRFCLEVVEMKSVSSAFYFNREIQCHFLYFVCFGLLGWDGTLNLFTRYVIILQVQNCFKIKEDNSFETKTPIPKQKDVRPRSSQSSDCINSVDTVEAAAAAAASQIAEAENKSYVAAEAVKEAERISSMAEDTYSQLQLLKEIFERCSRGEIVVMA